MVSRFFEASVCITVYGVSVPSLHRESTDSLINQNNTHEWEERAGFQGGHMDATPRCCSCTDHVV